MDSSHLTSSVQSAFASNLLQLTPHAPFALSQLPNPHPGIPLPGGRPGVLPSLSIRVLTSRSSASFGYYPLLSSSRSQKGRREQMETDRSMAPGAGFLVLGLIATASLLVAGFCGIRWVLIDVPNTTQEHIASMREQYRELSAAELIREYEQMDRYGIELVTPYKYKQLQIKKDSWGRNASIAAAVAGLAVLGGVCTRRHGPAKSSLICDRAGFLVRHLGHVCSGRRCIANSSALATPQHVNHVLCCRIDFNRIIQVVGEVVRRHDLPTLA